MGCEAVMDDLYVCSCRSAGAELPEHSLNSAVVSVVPLLCGGYGINSSSSVPLSSVYQAAGPVLCNLTVSVSHTALFTGQLVELVATAHSLAALTMPLGEFFWFPAPHV